jgi:hypothetical protein
LLFLTNDDTINGFAVANPMGDATEAILGAIGFSVDPSASASCWFTIAIPIGDAT